MKKFYLLILLMILCQLNLWATHIVGGEIQIRHLNNYYYEASLNLYFDDINGNKNAEDPSITITFYSKANNQLIERLTLLKVSDTFVNYSNPNCSSSQLRTRLLVYRSNITLSPNIYNNEQGYYVIWERCCRNGTIDNIVNPGGAGMTFYTEIPPVIKNGVPFVNSTPFFNIPKGDYLCQGKPFNFDFGAQDADGDMLVYSFQTPINGNSRPSPDALITPPPFPAPYELINWKVGFSANNAIPSDPNEPTHQMQINAQNGLIKVTPNQQGLFVFSVRCEEYRNGQKIGEVRRDFQLLVINCPTNNSPIVNIQTGTDGNGKAIYYTSDQTLTVDAVANQLCFDVYVKDIDALNDNVTARIRGINFTPRTSFLTPSSGVILGSDSLKMKFCWDKCLFSSKDNNGNLIPLEFELIVDDNGCPASNADTLRVKLISPPVVDNPPLITTDASPVSGEDYEYYEEVIVGGTFNFNVFGQDLLDNDNITLSAQGRGFELADLGILFSGVSGQGTVQSPFVWQTNCQTVKEDENEYLIDFIVKDEGFCENKTDTVTVKLVVKDKPISLEFLPANVFTPNGDDKNQVFKIPDLPEENCQYYFKKIEIFNRWGGKIFESDRRDFEWAGDNYPTGSYYYLIDYNKNKYKGWVSLLK